jgi:hypothetical protein
MDLIEEIEAAITSLPPEEYRRLVEWFRGCEQTRWDEQIDLLFWEAESESKQRLVQGWPQPE